MNKPKRVTNRIAKSIREARLSGATWLNIAKDHGVSLSTAMRYGDPSHREKQLQHERERYQRDKNKRSSEGTSQ